MIVVDLILLAGALLISVPSWVFAGECFLAWVPGAMPRRAKPNTPRPNFVVLVPAHNEEKGIGDTLEALKDQLGDEDRILVVADNCTDATAQVAREAGVDVVERTDPEQRGKGFALVFGLDHLEDDTPDVVIVFDADCRVTAGDLGELAREAFASGGPVQAEYILDMPQNAGPAAAVSTLAFIVRNAVRPRGLQRLALPCHLMGTGMAFPWLVLRNAPPTESYLVEDLLMGVDLTKMGTPPLFLSTVQVSSVLPEADDAAQGQRRRWEHGQLTTLVANGPPLLLRGLVTFRPTLVSTGLDLMVPPLALLVMLLGAGVLVTLVAALLGASVVPFLLTLLALTAILVAVVGSWFFFARQVVPASALLSVPFYLLWKLPIYLNYALKKRQKTWERTERSDKVDQIDEG